LGKAGVVRVRSATVGWRDGEGKGGEGREGDGDGGVEDIQVVQNKRFFSGVETNNRQ